MKKFPKLIFRETVAPPLSDAEKAWLHRLHKVLAACPSSRLASATSGDAKLVIYDRTLEKYDMEKAFASQDFIPYLRDAEIALCDMPMPFEVASTAA